MGLFEISYLTLGTLVSLHATLLMSIVTEIRKLFDGDSQHAKISEVPSFTAQLMDSTDFVSTRDLRGKTTGMLFVDAASAMRLEDNVLTSIIYVLWHKAHGNLYLVCAGSPEQCRSLRETQQLRDTYGGTIRVVMDGRRDLAERFGVSYETPSAVVIGPNGQIVKTGSMVKEVAS